MSSNGTIRITWRNGEDDFCLAKFGEMLALEEKCGVGVRAVLGRLHNDTWGINDVRETIRLGLIGAGMPPEKAMMAVKLHVDGNPQGLFASVMVAQAILAAVMVGVKDDQVGKEKAAEAAKEAPAFTTPTAASAAPPSTEPVQVSDGIQESSTASPSGNLPPPSMDTTAQTPATSFRPIL